MPEEGEPGRSVRVSSWFKVMDQNASDDIGMKIDAEGI